MTTTEAPSITATAAPAVTYDRTFSILALVAGIVSVVFGQTFLVPIAAIVLGVLGYQREPAGRAFAVWGLVLGAFMLVGWVLVAIYAVPFIAPFVAFSML